MKSLHPKEIEAVLQQKAPLRYQYFMKRVADFEVMYSLQDEDGDWVMADLDGSGLFCVWPFPEFATACAIEGWEGSKVIPIDLAMYQEQIVPMIQEEGLLLNVFSSPTATGFIVNAAEFARDLNTELAHYQ